MIKKPAKKKLFPLLAKFFIFIALVFGLAAVFFPLPGDVPVLMYHFIGAKKDADDSKNFVTVKSFSRQMAFLKWMRYRVISLDDFYALKSGQRKPLGREILITFDDGNESFETKAFPVLKNYQFPVTLFLVSESVKRGTNGSMTAKIIISLLSNPWIAIGSHTKTHPFLTEMDEAQIKDELEGSKKDLELIFERKVDYLAYPSGDFDKRAASIAEQAGYRLAFTTSQKKLKGLKEGPFALTREKVSRSSDNLFIFWFETSGIYQFLKKSQYQLKTLFPISHPDR